MNLYSSSSRDIINQITLNCLVDKHKLAKISSKKNRQNLEIERNENINKNRNELIKLFTDLLNHEYNGDKLDGVNTTFTHFIDECLIHLDMCKNVSDEDSDENIDEYSKNLNECNNDINECSEILNECNNDIDECSENLEEKIFMMMANCINKNNYHHLKLCEMDDENSDDFDDNNNLFNKKKSNNDKNDFFYEDDGDY